MNSSNLFISVLVYLCIHEKEKKSGVRCSEIELSFRLGTRSLSLMSAECYATVLRVPVDNRPLSYSLAGGMYVRFLVLDVVEIYSPKAEIHEEEEHNIVIQEHDNHSPHVV